MASGGRLILALLAWACAPPDSGCQQGPLRIRCAHDETWVETPAGDRAVYWALPTGEAPDAGWPAVVGFQGSFYGAKRFWRGGAGSRRGGRQQARLTATLLEGGYAVITPEAPLDGKGWWGTNVPGIAGDWEGSADDALMSALLDGIGAGDFGPLDLDRLYATGISSGGYMTSRMAVSYPGVFRALAIHSASYATCAGVACVLPDTLPEDHPPTLFLHGGADAVVPVWTMTAYRDRLEDDGVLVDSVVKPLAGHRWLKAGPRATLAWFDAR